MAGNETSVADLRRQLMEIVVQEGMLEGRQVSDTDKLSDVGIESADYVMILMAIEEKFGVYVPVDERLTSAETVGALLDVVTAQIVEHQEKTA